MLPTRLYLREAKPFRCCGNRTLACCEASKHAARHSEVDLDGFVSGLPNGIDTQVGERGARISGGQRQRLGIARAMFTRPHLLVLDEATSSLDGETEANISDAIHALRGSTTVVIIAHRLSTIRNADRVVYLSEGKVLATGSFDQVRKAVPDFELQAKIMGL